MPEIILEVPSLIVAEDNVTEAVLAKGNAVNAYIRSLDRADAHYLLGEALPKVELNPWVALMTIPGR